MGVYVADGAVLHELEQGPPFALELVLQFAIKSQVLVFEDLEVLDHLVDGSENQLVCLHGLVMGESHQAGVDLGHFGGIVALLVDTLVLAALCRADA